MSASVDLPTNWAAGLTEHKLSHEEVTEVGEAAGVLTCSSGCSTGSDRRPHGKRRAAGGATIPR